MQSGSELTVGEGEAFAALLTRAQDAVARSGDLVREAVALVGSSSLLREDLLSARCAWCGRYRLDDRWFEVDELPLFAAHLPEASHTICPRCITELRAAGMSN